MANGGASAQQVEYSAFVTDDPRLHRRVGAKLTNARAQLSEHLQHAQDWADFCKRIGRLAGLDDALTICEEVEKELNGPR